MTIIIQLLRYKFCNIIAKYKDQPLRSLLGSGNTRFYLHQHLSSPHIFDFQLTTLCNQAVEN